MLKGGAVWRSDADHADVVGQHRAVVEVHDVGIRIDPCHAALGEGRAQARDQRLQLVPLRRLLRERLVHRHRLVDKVRLRRDERDLGPIAGQVAQRQQSLQAGDPATGDDDLRHFGGLFQ